MKYLTTTVYPLKIKVYCNSLEIKLVLILQNPAKTVVWSILGYGSKTWNSWKKEKTIKLISLTNKFRMYKVPIRLVIHITERPIAGD